MSAASPPGPLTLDNQYDTDRVLRSYVRRHVPEPTRKTLEPELQDMGRRVVDDFRPPQRPSQDSDPSLTRWTPWGGRTDQIEEPDVGDRVRSLAAGRGVVSQAYEQEHGRYSRLHQMALAYLLSPSASMYGSELGMTDGVARTLREEGGSPLTEKAVSHLTSRDPETAWTAADWVTAHRPGSEASLPTASRDGSGAWRLHGRKPAAAAPTTNMALALARPEGATHPDLFYVPLRRGNDLQGPLRDGLRVNRLRDTLGARKWPTADLRLDGALAHPVSEKPGATPPNTAPIRRVTGAWRATMATALIRRSLALARDHGQKRTAYGDDIINHPLHQETLADAQATLEGAFHLSFRLSELMGLRETGQAGAMEDALFRLLAPLAELTTARQAASTTSKMLEAFGRDGYAEETGLPALHRNAQMLSLWGGTPNELSLDLLRTLREVGSFAPLKQDVERCVRAIDAPTLRTAIRPAVRGVRDAARWLKQALDEGEDAVHAGAGRFARTLGRSLEVLYTAHHAQWSLQEQQDGRSAAATERLAARRVNRVADLDSHGAYVLVWDFNCPTLFECHAAGDGAVEDEPVLDGFADVM